MDEIIVISSDDEESKSGFGIEHRCNDYRSAPTRKKHKRLRRKKKRPVWHDSDESTSSSDSELNHLSMMKWTVNMKSDMSHHSLVPKPSERVGKPYESISKHSSKNHDYHQSAQGLLRSPREGVIYQKRKTKKKLHDIHRESFPCPGVCECVQYSAVKHEKLDHQGGRYPESFSKERDEKSDISCHQTVTETLYISSGVSDCEDTLRSGYLKASLPLSPHSDFEELHDHEISRILNQRDDKLDELDRYSPVSPPSSIKSPKDSCGILQDFSSAVVCHPATGSNMVDVFPKKEVGDVNEDGEPIKNFSQETSFEMEQETSDFEDVLSISTQLALSQPAAQTSDVPEESDDELPEIDYFSAEVVETLPTAGNGPPPVLGRYGLSPTPNDVQELEKQILRLSETEDWSSASGEADWEDSEDFESKSDSAMNVQSMHNKSLVRKILPPNHICGMRDGQIQDEDDLQATPLFTSHMMDLVEACHEEKFLSSALSFIQSFTTTKLAPPDTTIKFVLKSVLLEMSTSSSVSLQAYKVLRHVHSLHTLCERTFEVEWEFLKEVFSNIVNAMSSFAISNKCTSGDRLMLALRFMVSVFESVVFHEDESINHPSMPTLERYMVRDVLSWLDVCMTTFDTWSSYAHQQFVHELITQLQKLLHFCCLRRFGNHKDFVATNLVHNLFHLSLPQKRHFLQTITCHELRQQLVERYLDLNFEIPCCSVCSSNNTKAASTCQLSLQKLCYYHVHQRPLVVTQSVGDDDDDSMYCADEETGERIIIEPKQEVGSLRRHCTRCSRRIRLKPEHCEELVLLLLCLLQSLIQCPYPQDSVLNQKVPCQYPRGSPLHKDDETVLAKLDEHVNTLTEDLMLSCSKLTVRTRLFLKEMSCLKRELQATEMQS